MRKRFRAIAALAAVALTASACSDVSSPPELGAETLAPPSTAAAAPTPSPRTSMIPSGWQASVLGERGGDAQVLAANHDDITVVASNTDTRIVAWVDDGDGFELVEITSFSAETHTTATAIAATDGGFVLAVNDWESFRPKFWTSNDGHAWELHEPLGLDEPTDVFGLLAVGDVTLAVGAARVGNRLNIGPFDPAIWRSEDLTTWARASLDAIDGVVIDVVDTGAGLLAFSRDGTTTWRSIDNGESWTSDSSIDIRESAENWDLSGAVQRGGVTLAVAWSNTLEAVDGLSILTSADAGDTWTRQTLDPRVAAGIYYVKHVSDAGDAFWIVASRRHDAWNNPDRCYAELPSCQSFSKPVVLRSTDGRAWDEVDLGAMTTAEYLNVDLVVGGGETLSFIGSTGEFTAWQRPSSDAPPLHDVPAPLAPLPTELVEWDARLEQGVTYRFPFYIHCGMEYLGNFNGTHWYLADAPSGTVETGAGQSPQPHWPVAQQTIFGTVTLVDDDRIEYSIGDGDVIGIYDASDEQPPGCM